MAPERKGGEAGLRTRNALRGRATCGAPKGFEFGLDAHEFGANPGCEGGLFVATEAGGALLEGTRGILQSEGAEEGGAAFEGMGGEAQGGLVNSCCQAIEFIESLRCVDEEGAEDLGDGFGAQLGFEGGDGGAKAGGWRGIRANGFVAITIGIGRGVGMHGWESNDRVGAWAGENAGGDQGRSGRRSKRRKKTSEPSH